MTPEEMLVYAHALTQQHASGTRGLWPRASALLGRMALERAVSAELARHDPMLPGATMRSQLLCYRMYQGDDLAQAAAEAWAGLSRACHHHPYELAPTSAELLGWLDQVDRVVRRPSASAASPRSEHAGQGDRPATGGC
jgi:hypothetical protein